jgi:hypothetical protein
METPTATGLARGGEDKARAQEPTHNDTTHNVVGEAELYFYVQ